MRLVSGILMLCVLCGCSTTGGGMVSRHWRAVLIEMDAPNWKHSHKRVTSDGQLTSGHLSGHAVPWLHRFSARMTPQDLATLTTLITALTPEEMRVADERALPDYRRLTIEFEDGSRLVAVARERERFGSATVESIWDTVRTYRERAW